MNIKALLAATVAGGIVANVLDMVVQGGLLTNAYYSKLPQLFRQDANVAFYILGDFIAVAIFAWFYQAVSGGAFKGAAGGMKFGVFTGVVVSFPSMLFMQMMFQGFPYALAWIWVAFTIVWYCAVGTIVGLVFEKVK